MLAAPELYGLTADFTKDDPLLTHVRGEIIRAAAILLEKSGLIKYERISGNFISTELGRISSHFYISHNSMAIYNQHLRATSSSVELFRIFALSDEFKLIPVRQDVRNLRCHVFETVKFLQEKLELSKLLERVPVPVKEGFDEPTAKINVLLQAHISRLKLDGTQ